MIYLLIGMTCVVLLFMWLIWLEERPNDAIYIKFKTFVSFYNINPDRWELDDSNVVFIKERYYCVSGRIFYKFHFIDYYRYIHWHKKLIKQKKLQEEMNDMNEMIRIVKSDIAKLEAESQANMQSAAKSIRDITSRM